MDILNILLLISILSFISLTISVLSLLNWLKKQKKEFELFYEDKDNHLIISWTNQYGDRQLSINNNNLFSSFRNGNGYEYIEQTLNELKVSGGVSDKEIDKLREFIRCWGHNHEKD